MVLSMPPNLSDAIKRILDEGSHFRNLNKSGSNARKARLASGPPIHYWQFVHESNFKIAVSLGGIYADHNYSRISGIDRSDSWDGALNNTLKKLFEENLLTRLESPDDFFAALKEYSLQTLRLKVQRAASSKSATAAFSEMDRRKREKERQKKQKQNDAETTNGGAAVEIQEPRGNRQAIEQRPPLVTPYHPHPANGSAPALNQDVDQSDLAGRATTTTITPSTEFASRGMISVMMDLSDF
jgi:hypothetical protein